ncbi:synembryn-A [Strongylocentrotus purpuratus]|uniref:Synembryn-A n=1 Tax=Strongylocentrotus purpuratus TaxID=7668 RepID=A0A7M7P2B8_STRPU|nr:synembryn-A [Strongylocentrotus purpuratus]
MNTLLVSAVPAFESGNQTEICNKLQEFTKENAGTFSFTDVQLETKKKFVGDVVTMLEATDSWECQLLCLESLKIFSRDKYNMLQLEQKECVHLLAKLAGLSEEPKECDIKVVTEAQKCLCNLVFNNANVRTICSESTCVEKILARTKRYSDSTVTWETKFYDMRLLFLLTALTPDLRAKIRTELSGIEIFTGLLETEVLCDIEDRESMGTMGASEKREIITAAQADLAGEILKTFFNIIVHVKVEDLQGEDDTVWKRLGISFRALLLSDAENEEKTEAYHSHTVNMLTLPLPKPCVMQLIPEPQGATGGSSTYHGYSMDLIAAILKFLEKRIEKCGVKDGKQYSLVEQLNPAISALCVLSRCNRYIRKHLKEQVLPPLRDASLLPEEGDSLRNKLVRFMTNPSTEIKESVADFIFILCKESVSRMVKYTGYGNAAGMLARRGLLHGGRGNTDYSDSDGDSDSDTEEYREVRDRINPITGRVEEDKPDPMEGMSEEQKEFHARELAVMITKMANEGVITPMAVGQDGRLISMQEIMGRAEAVENQENGNGDTDGD